MPTYMPRFYECYDKFRLLFVQLPYSRPFTKKVLLAELIFEPHILLLLLNKVIGSLKALGVGAVIVKRNT